MPTYTFTLRSGVTLVDASPFPYNGVSYDIDAQLAAGGGSIVTTDETLAAILRARRVSDGLLFDVNSVAGGTVTPPSLLLPVVAPVGDFSDQQSVVFDAATGRFKPGSGLGAGKLAELAVWGESYTQHGGKGWEDQFITIACDALGIAVRNNGHSGSKLLVGEGENPNATGIPGSAATVAAGAQLGGYGQLVQDTILELQARNVSSYSDTAAAITTVQPLMGLAPSLLVYGPNDLAQFGNTAATATLYGNALRYAIAARRVAYVIGANNTTFHVYSGAGWTNTTAFTPGVNGSWGQAGSAQSKQAATGASFTDTLPTDLDGGQVYDLFLGVPNTCVGSVAVTVNGTPVAGSPFTLTAPAYTGSPAPHVIRVPLTSTMAGKALVATFTVTSGAGPYYGGSGFEPSLTSTGDGLPAPVLVANNPRLPDAAAATWFAGTGWAGPPTDAGAALINAQVTAIIGEFDRFVQIVDLDTPLNKVTGNFNAGDVHPGPLGAHAMAAYMAQAVASMRVTQAEAFMARSYVRRPWATVLVVPPATGSYTWTSQPTGDTEFMAATLPQAFRVLQELSRFTEYRIVANVATGGGTGAKLYAKFSTDNGANWGYLTYDGQLASLPPVEAVAITATGLQRGSWWPMTHAARQTNECLLSVFGSSTVSGSPVLRSIQLQLR